MKLVKLLQISILVFSLKFTFGQTSSNNSILEPFLSTTVAIGQDTIVEIPIDGKIVKKRIFNTYGTGVICYVKQIKQKDTVSIPCIVTAKHVVYYPNIGHLPKSINLRLNSHSKEPLDTYFGVKVNLYDNQLLRYWIELPNDNVDLACIPLSINVDSEGSENSVNVLPYSKIKNISEMSEGQSIYIFGFPGIGSIKYGTKPILRKGIISWTSPVNTDDVPFLVDCNVYPGNSGGPVFVDEGGLNPNGSFVIGSDFSFIGIVSEMIERNKEVSSINYKYLYDDKKGIIFSSESFSLGVIIPAKKVRELLQYSEKIMNQ